MVNRRKLYLSQSNKGWNQLHVPQKLWI